MVNFSLILESHPLQIKKALLSTSCVISQFPRIMGIIDLATKNDFKVLNNWVP